MFEGGAVPYGEMTNDDVINYVQKGGKVTVSDKWPAEIRDIVQKR